MKRVTVVSSLLFFFAMSGCVSPMQQYKLGFDTCGSSKTRSLIGGVIDDIDMDAMVGEKFDTRRVDPRIPDRVYTTDLRVRRQNVVLDEDGVFRLVDKRDYVLTREYATFSDFADRIVRPDPGRSAIFAQASRAMEETYDRVIDDADGARVLHQPCAAYHFAVPG